MTDKREETEEAKFETLEYWKNFNEMSVLLIKPKQQLKKPSQLAKKEELEKKNAAKLQEDRELANYRYKYLPFVIQESRLDLLDTPEAEKELEIVQKQV